MISKISTLISLKPLSQDKNLSRFYLSKNKHVLQRDRVFW